ncbi:hypothetical protein CRYUN_Cryun07bG0102700 [Craigia yunnanensis]
MEEARNNIPSETHVNKTNNNKRKLSVSDNEDLQDSYFKICPLVRKLRPHFMQMIVEKDPPVNLVTELQTLSGENVFGEQAPDKFQEGKEAELLKTEDCVEKATDIKHPMRSSSSEWKLNDDQFRGSYIVGGSVFGSNFITYGGSKPVYYGLTKESYLSKQVKS